MKINENYVLQEVADENIIIPVGEAADKLHGIIKLNITGAYLWKLLSQDDLSTEELTEKMITEFSVDEGTAKEDISMFVKRLSEYGCFE